MKRTLAFFLLMFFLPLFTGCSLTTTSTTVSTEPGTTYEYDDFSDLLINSPEDQLTRPETDYYIYFYGEHCYLCQTIKQEALAYIASLETDKVYLVRVSSYDDINEAIDFPGTPSIAHIVAYESVNVEKGESGVLGVLENLT